MIACLHLLCAAQRGMPNGRKQMLADANYVIDPGRAGVEGEGSAAKSQPEEALGSGLGEEGGAGLGP